ncbi:class I SAM-dependent methyltransferase [Helicobacter sp. MIT 21-1697]|uniref:class I SAM-dependent methyltransferase n=1 Tax=Helicobacter sp. MIT 21-1697 TaxID=2993733 RepID=UPI00224ADD80|nr:class I SAM-dependent methyltransferase [Helicobacter sp. MIT 21-1697]MCX2717899.1 class I SAM-dependent methyltransferase [Helicobacter sp. MIT 21-1697]
MKKEQQRLENIAQDYNNPLQAKEVTNLEIFYGFEIFKRFYSGGDVLEMGPAEGVMTKYLVDYVENLEVLEGSSHFAQNLKKQFPHLNVHNALFEEFKPSKKYDCIIMGHVLEHVESPQQILNLAKGWLKDCVDISSGGGIMLSLVPNSHSLHRQAAVKMGLLKSEDSMSEADIFHGHRRIYDLQSLQKEFLAAGLKIIDSGGYWLKPLSNAQIQAYWDSQMILAFMELGEIYPQIAGDIYVVASL